ncbi:MAG: hypothetical protein A2589_03280 [Candidatus Vogelbacteria bacterium RIFOXYD1_FULL_46_19]|uniref:Uncharacterized protein n=1 Tax=Candidatus Vogelbacteria bacterium RIFOXYD1_FULL_46_19 TaxID=1802439 RepID=A0A1G2QHI2_9BACT|nr:MAG: hypothetical protein A2589_03280 [Candidatus Vogelbacteria bacterium RIFOXYD1_FULL_46_19]
MNNKLTKLWFKRKWYGWGWYPASVEGWLVTLIYAGGVLFFASATDFNVTKEVWLFWLLPVLLLTVTFIRLAYRFGESPRWQWGRPKKDDLA